MSYMNSLHIPYKLARNAGWLFDFISHRLRLRNSDGMRRALLIRISARIPAVMFSEMTNSEDYEQRRRYSDGISA